MALGAQPADVRRLILGQGARLAVYGIGAGLLGAFVVTRWMGTMLFGVEPDRSPGHSSQFRFYWQWWLSAASYLPSRRAMSLEPVSALRHE